MRVLYLLLILTVITLILAQWAGDKPPNGRGGRG